MTPLSEEEMLDLLLQYYGWDDTDLARWHALRVLRSPRGEEMPTFDDYCCARRRRVG